MEESSSENAAMVLKITETSQGNVCPVDIWLGVDVFLNSTMTYDCLHAGKTGHCEQWI
jgi:hypothetical protein